jgi:hypothetical protein
MRQEPFAGILCSRFRRWFDVAFFGQFFPIEGVACPGCQSQSDARR